MISYQTRKQERSAFPLIQTKLKVGKPGDKYEQEADKVANNVMRMPQGGTVQMKPIEEDEKISPKLQMSTLKEGQNNILQAKCKECEEDKLQMKPSIQLKSQEQGEATSGVSMQIMTSKGNGQAMDKATRSDLGGKMGYNFDNVRIHSDSKAADLSQSLGARAFTVGKDIYFNRGEYNPGNTEGKRLLAHELTHVVQQSGNGSVQREMIQKDDDAKKKKKKEPKVTTKVEVANKTDFKKDPSKNLPSVKTSTTEEREVSDSVKSTTKTTTSVSDQTGSGEIKVSDKGTGISGTVGIKGTSSFDPTVADKGVFYLKVGGKWKKFRSVLSSLSLGSSVTFSPIESPAFAVDGSAVFLPNSRIQPSLAFKLLYGEEFTGTFTAGLQYKITEDISAKAGVSLTTDSQGNLSTSAGAGLTFTLW